jgi:hypothetical protein
MRLKALTLGAALALVGASVAVAAPPTGKGKPATTGAGCKPSVAVIIRGTLAANGATAPSALSVNVTGANHFGAAFKKAVQPLAIQITSSTKIDRRGDKNPADLKSGDKVNIQARSCKADLAHSATPSLTATRVTAHPAAA